MSDIFKRIEELGVLPELTLHDAIDAIPVGRAIADGGISMAEVTFRTEAAEDSIRLMANAIPGMLIGAGTVLTIEQVDAAVKAGAKFIVSPGIHDEIVRYCLDKDIPVIPGVSTPTDIENALRLGLSLVKFFPAESNGGIKALRAMSEPYPGLRFMPSGGLNEDNVADYLRSNKVLAVAGNWMATQEMIRFGDMQGIQNKCARAVRLMLGFTYDHVGLNFPKDEEAESAAEDLARIFDADMYEDTAGFFVGNFFEGVKPGGPGLYGHIAYRTYHLGRAMAYLKEKGLTFDNPFARYDEDGRLEAVFSDQEVGGMSLMLMQQ
ncbi:MAG: bifunctional 4-hydroxy-2-oxoglutarate aldolase/2-dehydro-3-deoxy-phosphogluconate aldolase [Lachnospiraceae bacterium]|nr:bifunctional 4-hydroxy-2-oxoglutarate aldolase/2-dehydro-3-deoxy-phosphogluconate aldolase [Lachnospiraceae bacterium]